MKIILRGAKFVTNKAYLHQRSNADKKWGQGNQKAGNRAHARSLRALRKSLALQKRIDRRG